MRDSGAMPPAVDACGVRYSGGGSEAAGSKGVGKLELNRARLEADINEAWEVLGEAVQTVMRRYGIPEPYEKLKALTRGQEVTGDVLTAFSSSGSRILDVVMGFGSFDPARPLRDGIPARPLSRVGVWEPRRGYCMR